MSQHADDPNISTQHCWAQQWRVWHAIARPALYISAFSLDNQKKKKKKMSLVVLLMLHDVCSPPDQVLVFSDEFVLLEFRIG